MQSRSTRRQFLRGLAACSLSLASQRLAWAANSHIQVGVVGLGSRGFNLLESFLKESDVKVVALCDVHDLHYRDMPWEKGRAMGLRPAADLVKQKSGHLPEQTNDYRQLCGRSDLDAVVVATPDHWHAQCTLEALRHGKDIYCEKPVTHLFAEGQRICDEVDQRKAVFQTGSQQRSDPLFRQALKLIDAGLIGPVQSIEVGLPPGYDGPQGSTDVATPPNGLNYDRWCGPASLLPYMRARHHRWWRGHTAYGGGVLMDWIGHHNDIAHMSLKTTGPVEVRSVGWEFPDTPIYNTPAQYTIACTYEGGVTSTISSRNTQGVKWIGPQGWIYVTRGKLEASNPEWIKPLPKGSPDATDLHVRNFVDCVKSRSVCIAPPRDAHRSITPGHLGYVAQAVGRPLKWHPQTEQIVGDAEADKLLKYVEYRSGWETA